jgi:catechol 2,3-dioxygenase-like lactoylglutathione lyase family enzyme
LIEDNIVAGIIKVSVKLKFDHIALSVANLDRSISFYRDLMGFDLVRIIEISPGTRLGEVVGIPGSAARIAHLQSGSAILELLEYVKPRGKAVQPDRTQADNGFTHLGFSSQDIHADYERLISKGVVFYNKPIEYRPKIWVAYFYGPDGESCELRQSME